jgi:hypothetical protein
VAPPPFIMTSVSTSYPISLISLTLSLISSCPGETPGFENKKFNEFHSLWLYKVLTRVGEK